MDPQRRILLKALLATPCIGVAASRAADPLPELSPDDPQAKSLGYVVNAAGLTAAKEPAFHAGSTCANCSLFQSYSASDAWAPCSVFPGKRVSAAGWCRSWTNAM